MYSFDYDPGGNRPKKKKKSIRGSYGKDGVWVSKEEKMYKFGGY
jgi:hypothetical protein